MVEYRSFHNTDPPRIVGLWNTYDMGRGVASGLTVDAFEYYVFAQPYFDRTSIIVAVDGDQLVGFAQVIKAVNDDESALGGSRGSIVALLVHPDFRRKGIGTELVRRATERLRKAGVQFVRLGPDNLTNGFYMGMYGGAQPNGFLQADGAMQPFAQSLGMESAQRFRCYQRDLNQKAREPMSIKLIANRRNTVLQAVDPSSGASWWWVTRYGRLDAVRFNLLEKRTNETLAFCELFGLDLYIAKWGQRAAGLGRIVVPEQHRGNDYELSLLLGMGKYLKDQLVTILDVSIDEQESGIVDLLESVGFEHYDTGTVFAQPSAAADSP